MPKVGTKEWPREDVAQLYILSKMGLTARLIGDRLGYSRNAVCGKLGREGIKLTGIRRDRHLRERVVIKDKRIDIPPKEPMGNGCLWPMGDKWCGCDRQEERPYCTVHQKQSMAGRRALTDSEIRRLVLG